MEPKNPLYAERIREQLTRQEFMKHIGCTLPVIEVGYVEAELVLMDHHRQQVGITHGGVIATMADVAAGFAGFTLVSEKQQMVTVELKTSYLFPLVGILARAKGRVVKHGNTLSFCEADVYSVDEHGTEKLCARATATMAIVS
ncbi:MAG: PaaI family thioesterase [Candidatus Kapaibacterium sp.]